MKFPESINVKGKSIKKNNRITGELNKHFTNVGPNLASKIQNTSKTFEDFLFPLQKNKHFTNVGPNLASKIQNASKTFEDFLFPVQKNIEYRDLTFEEFEKDFKSVKRNKTAGHYDINSNVIINIYDEISYALFIFFTVH